MDSGLLHPPLLSRYIFQTYTCIYMYGYIHAFTNSSHIASQFPFTAHFPQSPCVHFFTGCLLLFLISQAREHGQHSSAACAGARVFWLLRARFLQRKSFSAQGVALRAMLVLQQWAGSCTRHLVWLQPHTERMRHPGRLCWYQIQAALHKTSKMHFLLEVVGNLLSNFKTLLTEI